LNRHADLLFELISRRYAPVDAACLHSVGFQSAATSLAHRLE